MKRLIWIIAAIAMMISMASIPAFAGGGDPILGEWALTTDKTQTFEIHKDKNTGTYSLKDASGELALQKKDKHTFVASGPEGDTVLSLDTSSGTLTVEKNGATLFYRKALHFIRLTLFNFTFLFLVGFIGGLVSGFIGSGGAFVLTPSMMSLGVDGLVAVASNMCHKFPKAMVGAYKRYKYGQVDLKMGTILAANAIFGVLVGIRVQQYINEILGDAGSNLYVSFALLVVLVVVGGFVFNDARKIARTGGVEKISRLAKAVQKINLFPMMTFNRSKIRISFWFTVPIGFACGFLAATIAVGGFVGVPGMIYVLGMSSLMASASELVIAFGMGFVGSVQWGMLGLIDIRLTLIILTGSILGIQLGALGTTYVKDYVIKVVMGTIMLMFAVSRGLAIPIYLRDLEWMTFSDSTAYILKLTSFGVMCIALLTGAVIILNSMFKEMRAERAAKFAEVATHGNV